MILDKGMKWVPLLMFGLPGVIGTIFGLYMAKERLPLIRDGIEVQGTVVANSKETDQQNVTSFYPVVELRLENGKLVRFQNDTGRDDSPEYSEGSQVAVVRTRHEPMLAKLISYKELWQTSLYISLLGLAFLFSGIASFILVKATDQEIAAPPE